jgi:hypothetical protein
MTDEKDTIIYKLLYRTQDLNSFSSMRDGVLESSIPFPSIIRRALRLPRFGIAADTALTKSGSDFLRELLQDITR